MTPIFFSPSAVFKPEFSSHCSGQISRIPPSRSHSVGSGGGCHATGCLKWISFKHSAEALELQGKMKYPVISVHHLKIYSFSCIHNDIEGSSKHSGIRVRTAICDFMIWEQGLTKLQLTMKFKQLGGGAISRQRKSIRFGKWGPFTKQRSTAVNNLVLQIEWAFLLYLERACVLRVHSDSTLPLALYTMIKVKVH